MESRRSFLKLAGLSGITSIVALQGAKALADACDFRPTPKQPLGPFYPLQIPLEADTDLTKMAGSSGQAFGEVIWVTGVVTDDYCKPIPGAIVEIWQACYTGRYNHPSDTSDNALDPNFQYYGVMKTNERGEYSFKTIKPGSYLASQTWRRPPHIHFKVSLRGYRDLVTQLYFAGDSLNETDEILRAIPEADQKKLVVDFVKQKFKQSTESVGKFDLTLKKA